MSDKTLLIFSSILFFIIQKLILVFVLQIISCSLYLVIIYFASIIMVHFSKERIFLNDTRID